MNNNPVSSNNNVQLDPADSPQGAMERVFLAETYAPGKKIYDLAIDLKSMRNMRQVISNRLKNPSFYNAKGAKNEIDIIKMGHQFAKFDTYPNLNKDVKENLDKTIEIANGVQSPLQEAYEKHVKNAITAATESINPPVAEFPNATGWMTTEKNMKGPGGNFYPLADVGGNTFYATKTVPLETVPKHKAMHRAVPHQPHVKVKPLFSFTPKPQILPAPLAGLRQVAATVYAHSVAGQIARQRRGIAAQHAQNQTVVLPSVAPPPGSSSGPRFGSLAHRVAGGTGYAVAPPVARHVDEDAWRRDPAMLGRALDMVMDRTARLPPQGMTGFDDRLSPRWAGLKLPS